MIAIVDYGMANLRSVEKALAMVGGDPVITSSPATVAQADKVVLPGVGAFCAAMNNLNRSGLREAVVRAIEGGKPFLGICLGLQMLFEESSEMGATPGLGVLPGRVVSFFARGTPPEAAGLKVPHIGWNALHLRGNGRLLRGLPDNARVYFVHSYYPEPADLKVPHIGWNALHLRGNTRLLRGLPDNARVYFVHSYYPEPAQPEVIAATSDYGVDFCCAVEKENIAATQFHPEKSGAVGLQILRNFVVGD